MPELDELLARIDQLKAELDSLRPLPRDLEERILQKFRLWWTFHSNAIEGNKLTQGETEVFLMEGLTAKGKPLKDHLDLRGHSNAVNYLLAFIREKDVLTEAAIRKLHEVLLGEAYRVPAITPDGAPTTKAVTLGVYKTEPNHVRTPTGEIHYYATPLDTPGKMHELIAWLRAESDKGELHPVEIAARFHHEFTAIHPFDDGNGRMARLLMNLLLMQNGYPPVVIRNEERDEYLAVLRAADHGHSENLRSFMAKHQALALDVYIRGARGKDISEPTDIEKDIALLRMELAKVEEPQTLTAGIQEWLFKSAISPIIKESQRLLLPLSELFSRALVSRSGTYGTDQMQQSFQDIVPLTESSLDPAPKYCTNNGGFLHRLEIEFQMQGFRKARLNTFDTSAALVLVFQPLKYSITLPESPEFLGQSRFYQEVLREEEVKGIAERLVRTILMAIRSRTASQD